MTESRFEFWTRWLIGANIMTMIIGLVLAFAGESFVFQIHNEYTQELFFEGNPPSAKMLELKAWLFGIIGATIIGFHFLMIMIARNAFAKKESWAYWAMVGGLLSWFLIDSSISTYYGAYYNVLLINLPAIILIGIPLVATRNSFK